MNLPAATGGDGTLTYSLTPAAPAGLAFDATARTLTGTPTTAQSATAYTYTATDADGDTASLTFNITVTADTQAPRVASIVRHDPPTSPTNAVSLTWRVTFSEAVVNVTDDDFHVGGTDGTETATAVGTDGTTWDVNVAGGNLVVLAGTVNLEFVQGQDIEDVAGNALTDTTPTGTNDDTYLLDQDPSTRNFNSPLRQRNREHRREVPDQPGFGAVGGSIQRKHAPFGGRQCGCLLRLPSCRRSRRSRR